MKNDGLIKIEYHSVGGKTYRLYDGERYLIEALRKKYKTLGDLYKDLGVSTEDAFCLGWEPESPLTGWRYFFFGKFGLKKAIEDGFRVEKIITEDVVTVLGALLRHGKEEI